MKHYEISKLLNNSTVSKFVAKRWIKVNDLSRGQYSDNKNIWGLKLQGKDQIYITIAVEGTSDVNKRN